MSASRTIRVPNLPDDRLVELHEVRASLEGSATEHATANLTAAAIDGTEQLIDTMGAALRDKDYDAYIRSHRWAAHPQNTKIWVDAACSFSVDPPANGSSSQSRYRGRPCRYA